ncbi:MAG: hypothetical protein FJ088_06915 [Deltaproteobacteria bacterium]|nr:hypothetical protein [Deltaproteobacteria bacterium]
MSFNIIKALRDISARNEGDFIKRLLPYFYFSDLEAMEQSMISDEVESRTIFGLKISDSPEPPLVFVNFLGANAEATSSLLDLLAKLNAISLLTAGALRRSVIIAATSSPYGLFSLGDLHGFVASNPYMSVVNAPTGGVLLLDIPASIRFSVILKRDGQKIKLPHAAAFVKITCGAQQQAFLTPVEKIAWFLTEALKKLKFAVPEIKVEERFFNYPYTVSALAVCDKTTADLLKKEAASVQDAEEFRLETRTAVPADIPILDSAAAISKMSEFVKKLREMLTATRNARHCAVSVRDFEQDRTGDIFAVNVSMAPGMDANSLKKDFLKILHSLEADSGLAGFDIINLSFLDGSVNSAKFKELNLPRAGNRPGDSGAELLFPCGPDSGSENPVAFFGLNKRYAIKKTGDVELEKDIEEIVGFYSKMLLI